MRRHYSTGEKHSKANGDTTSKNCRPKSATLPAGWSIEVDSESGRTFYFNNETNQSTWKPPSTDNTDMESHKNVCFFI